MITEPLTSEVNLWPSGVWAAAIIDREGQVPVDDVDGQTWTAEMIRAATLLSALDRPGVLVIVHPSGYGTG